MDMDAPLDFESEDPLTTSPALSKKRKKVIGLDDLLNDYYVDKIVKERQSKRAKAPKSNNSDEDDDTTQTTKEAELSKTVDTCRKQIEDMSSEDEISSWGLCVFGEQNSPPPLVFPAFESCTLLQSFLENEVNSIVNISAEEGETFLQGLLADGWLSKLVSMTSLLEKPIAIWTFNLMLYSTAEELRTHACDFWCSVLLSKDQIKIEWLPSYSQLNRALEVYGFLWDTSACSSNSKLVHKDSDCGGPPQNIRAWIRLIAACCQVRNRHAIFSTLEAEKLLEALIFLFLQRELQGLVVLVYECVLSVISFFTEEEWDQSREKVAKSIASRVPRDLNCLRILECISGINTRSKLLKSALAYEMLLTCFDNKVTDGKAILSFLASIKLKEKSCDLFMVYIYLILTENWLLSAPLENKSEIYKDWDSFLRNCSCQISTRDMRSYAPKVWLDEELVQSFGTALTNISFVRVTG